MLNNATKENPKLFGIDPRAARATWTAALIILLLWAVYLIRDALLVFTIALLLSYLLYPLMDWLDRHMSSKTRVPALIVTYLVVIGIVGTLGVFVGSVIARQATNLVQAAPAFLDRLQQTNPPPPPADGPIAPILSLKSYLLSLFETQLRVHSGEIGSFVSQTTLHVLSASRNLLFVVIIPILSFFILRDGRSIRDSFVGILDIGRATAKDTLMDIHHLLLVYMRALLVLCVATFVSFSIFLRLLGVPYSLLLACIAFPLEFIPVVGPLTAGGVIIAVCVLSGFAHTSWVLLFLLLYRLFQDYVLSPHLMSKGVELHPLIVIFGVFAGGEIGGVAGIFVSVPLLALARLLYHRMDKTYAARRPSRRPALAE